MGFGKVSVAGLSVFGIVGRREGKKKLDMIPSIALRRRHKIIDEDIHVEEIHELAREH